MKKNVFTIVAFIALSTFQQLAAQPFPLSPSVYKQFSPSVAKAVYNKLSRISTSTSTQLWLANAFVKRDSIIALQMVKGLSPKEIKKATDSLTLQLENGLKATMSNTEKKAYLDKIEVPRLEKEKYVGAAMNSQFVIALKNKTALGLSKSQEDRLLEKAKELQKKMLFANAHRDTLVFDRNAYQNEQMTKILSKDQYTACLAIKNSYYAAIKSKKRWDELSEKGLTANYEQNTVTKQLVTYELKIKIIIDQYGDDNKGAKKKALKNLATDAPALLKDAPMSVIIPATGALSNSQTATALLLKEQLKLTKQQTDELLVIIQTLKDKLEVAKTNKDSSTFNRGAFESTQMSKILSEEQYTKVLAERSKTFAERQAINSWNELKTNGLNTKYTKDSVLQQATTFFIKKHSVMERYQYNVQLRQKMLRITDMAMPDALAALARIKKTKNLQANNAGFAW